MNPRITAYVAITRGGNVEDEQVEVLEFVYRIDVEEERAIVLHPNGMLSLRRLQDLHGVTVDRPATSQSGWALSEIADTLGIMAERMAKPRKRR